MNIKLFLSMLAMSSVPVMAQADTPRGKDIKVFALGCGIPGAKQTYKSGDYHAICDELSEAEKCLALIKVHMYDQEGKVKKVPDELRVAARFCLATFTEELLD